MKTCVFLHGFNRCPTDRCFLLRCSGNPNREHKADLHIGGVLPTRPGGPPWPAVVVPPVHAGRFQHAILHEQANPVFPTARQSMAQLLCQSQGDGGLEQCMPGLQCGILKSHWGWSGDRQVTPGVRHIGFPRRPCVIGHRGAPLAGKAHRAICVRRLWSGTLSPIRSCWLCADTGAGSHTGQEDRHICRDHRSRPRNWPRSSPHIRVSVWKLAPGSHVAPGLTYHNSRGLIECDTDHDSWAIERGAQLPG